MRNWDDGALRKAMFGILADYGPEDAKRVGKLLGDTLLSRFFRSAFELGWKAGQERLEEGYTPPGGGEVPHRSYPGGTHLG